MGCDKCKSRRIMSVYVQGRDTHNLTYDWNEHSGYMPEALTQLYGNYGDAIEFKLCLECGKIQGDFPITEEQVTEAFKTE